MRIAITGAIAYDYIMSYPRAFDEMLLAENLDRISLSLQVDSMKRYRGGVAANIAYSMALLGSRPIVVGTVGRDFVKDKEFLEEVGVDTSGIKTIDNAFTASCWVATDCNQNQIAIFHSGATIHARNLRISDVVEEEPDLVVISSNDSIAMSGDWPAWL